MILDALVIFLILGSIALLADALRYLRRARRDIKRAEAAIARLERLRRTR